MSDHQSHTNNTMIMQYRTSATTGTVTTVDCQKQVRSWRLLRSVMELLIPTCNCSFLEENDFQKEEKCHPHPHHHQYYFRQPTFGSSTTTIIGTIFGSRRGKVSFCIQSIPKHHSTTAASPIILLLELAIPTVTLAREMEGGLLRIALESCNEVVVVSGGNSTTTSSLLSTPVWTMYCNGREAGLALKRKPSKVDVEVLMYMESVPEVGAGIISGKNIINNNNHDDDDDHHQREDVLYMRGKYERIQGSSNYESFHLMDPDGNVGQELSFFFLRSP